jgi:hypothetical protein
MQFYFSLNIKLGGFFGFITDQTISAVLFATSTQIVCTNPVNVLYLRSGSLIQFNNREFIVQKDDVSDIIYRVPIGTQVGTYIHQLYTTDPFYVTNNNITSFNFYLTNNLNYNDISLQNLPWSFKFSMIEYQMPLFDPLIPIVSMNPIQSKNEIDELKNKYEKELEKLLKYKEILTKQS